METEKSTCPPESGLSRRAVLSGLVPALAVAGTAAWAAPAAAEAVPPAAATPLPGGFPGLITREREPANLEMPFATLAGPLVPTPQFFVRSHFRVPTLAAAEWQLSIEGQVQRPVQLGYDELRSLPATTLAATLECAGNGRARLAPRPKGLLWEQGAVGTATWTGVPLAALLARAGLQADALEVVAEGFDQGEVTDEPRTPGSIAFARSLPLAKAQRPEVLVAYLMNGQPLPPEHGFPARLVVPGWYGMASVKWLRRLVVTAAPFAGYWQTMEYTHWQRTAQGQPTLVPVTEMQVKAEIARPALHEALPAGRPYRVHGAAWAGESEVATVEVSTDGGRSWQPARLLEAAGPYAWRLWEYQWPVPAAPGRYLLLARATDRAGRTQPLQHDPDRRNYMVNRLAPVEVLVG